ncbi:MAG: MFS transporter, partial [Bradyrhizobium sp.]
WIGHGVFIGLIGIGSINAPLYIYVSRWFDRRRGSALALISSGTYLAGTIWPPIFERAIASFGWRQAMLWYALAEIVVVVPLAVIYFREPPEVIRPAASAGTGLSQTRVLGWAPNGVFAMLCAAAVLCCIPMAMPQGHLVAFCSDLGISRSVGALMLSVLLGTAFLSRQVWGVISDRIGGLTTVLIGSAWQATSMTALLLTQNEVGLFTVSAAFGLGFSGIIPAYVLAVRELFPASEASWRIPTLLLFSGGGMGAGSWIAGLLYDHFGYYAPAFTAGIVANILNLLVVSVLVGRQRHRAVYA